MASRRKVKSYYGLFRKMRYRDTTFRKNTCIWYGRHCDRCAIKNDWTHGGKYRKYRPYGQCWFCGRLDFLNVGVTIRDNRWRIR